MDPNHRRGATVDNSAQSLQSEGGVESSGSQDFGRISQGFVYPFSTQLRRDNRARWRAGGAGRAGATPAPKTRQWASLAPTPADLQVLWGGRDRLLKIAEVAEHLGVSNATVYGLCERGELPYVWLVTSMWIRPRDLEEVVASRPTVVEKVRPHRRKTPAE